MQRSKFCDPIISWTVYKWPMPGQALMQFRWRNNKYLLHQTHTSYQQKTSTTSTTHWLTDWSVANFVKWSYKWTWLSWLNNRIKNKFIAFSMQYWVEVNTCMFVLQKCKYPCGSVAVDFACLRGFNLVLETNFGSAVRLTDIRTLNSFFFIQNQNHA